MAIASQTYGSQETAGVTVLVTCGVLSLTSVLGIIIILGMSAVRSRPSSDKTLFVRTQVASYFLSLLICNLVQSVGTLFNIAWFIGGRVGIGTACTAQATITELGNVGTAIFSFIIAAYTFSQLFLRRKWSDRTCYTVLTASWGLLVLNSCIGPFVVTNAEKGPYYGVSGYWCGITPAYRTGKYTSDSLLLLVSAAFSFILSLLVFFRLRGNITVSAGHKIHFHYRPQGVVGRTNPRSFVVTDDRTAESHFTTIAKQMQRHPIAYTVLVLPICATSLWDHSGASVPFLATVSTATVFVLSGFVNVVLFCSTRKDLPGRWKQNFGIDPVSYKQNVTRRLSQASGKISTRPASVALSITVEKDVETKYDGTEPGVSYPKLSRITLPTEPLRAHDGMQRDDPYVLHVRKISFPPQLHLKLDGDSPIKDLSAGAHPAKKANRISWDIPQHPVHSPKRRGSGMYGPTSGPEAPRACPFDLPMPVDTNARTPWSLSFSASKTVPTIDDHRLSMLIDDE